MTKLIVANWKMNPQSAKEAKRIFAGYEKQLTANSYKLSANVVVCPPFVYLSFISKQLTANSYKLKAILGAQDIFWENSGAYTGEISPMMLKDLGCEYVIVGHSERRKHLGETDEMINKKIRAAQEADLKVILCVGEPLEIREKGKKAVEDFLENQLQKDLEGLTNSPGRASPGRAGYKLTANSLVVAYEPIWAIGTGIPDTSQDAAETIGFIKKSLVKSHKLSVDVLYGGSVNSENAALFLNQDGIDGLLVGGASLDPDEFVKIIQSV